MSDIGTMKRFCVSDRSNGNTFVPAVSLFARSSPGKRFGCKRETPHDLIATRVNHVKCSVQAMSISQSTSFDKRGAYSLARVPEQRDSQSERNNKGIIRRQWRVFRVSSRSSRISLLMFMTHRYFAHYNASYNGVNFGLWSAIGSYQRKKGRPFCRSRRDRRCTGCCDAPRRNLHSEHLRSS